MVKLAQGDDTREDRKGMDDTVKITILPRVNPLHARLWCGMLLLNLSGNSYSQACCNSPKIKLAIDRCILMRSIPSSKRPHYVPWIHVQVPTPVNEVEVGI